MTHVNFDSACPKDAKPDPDKAALKAGLVEILGDDEDGIAATMEDFGLEHTKPFHCEVSFGPHRCHPKRAHEACLARILPSH